MCYEVLLRGGHVGPIVGLASAVSKSLLVSVGSDCTLRVWDLRRLECQLCAPLHDRPVCVSLHPDGTHLALGFESLLHVEHVGLDAVLPWRQVQLTGIRAVAYAHGGHLLAANTNACITLFDAYTLSRVANLFGHLAPVTTLSWAADARTLYVGYRNGELHGLLPPALDAVGSPETSALAPAPIPTS